MVGLYGLYGMGGSISASGRERSVAAAGLPQGAVSGAQNPAVSQPIPPVTAAPSASREEPGSTTLTGAAAAPCYREGGDPAALAVQGRIQYLSPEEVDKEIEKSEGMPVSEIFRRKGEEYFRELETGLLLSLESRSNTVVSCGGGVPLRSCNVEAMKRSGIVVFLTARPETILERVKDSHDRPLLEGHKDVEYIAGLLSKRLERYEAAADVQIATDGRRTAEIAEEIYALL